MLKLFESMVQPILLYGCEIWGIFGWWSNKSPCIIQYLLNPKHPFELVHTKLCKNILGIHKKASDLMAKAELGRFPLMSNIVKHTCNYWQHILKVDSESLLSSTFKVLKDLSDKGQINYITRYKMLLEVLNKQDLINSIPSSETKKA